MLHGEPGRDSKVADRKLVLKQQWNNPANVLAALDCARHMGEPALAVMQMSEPFRLDAHGHDRVDVTLELDGSVRLQSYRCRRWQRVAEVQR